MKYTDEIILLVGVIVLLILLFMKGHKWLFETVLVFILNGTIFYYIASKIKKIFSV